MEEGESFKPDEGGLYRADRKKELFRLLRGWLGWGLVVLSGVIAALSVLRCPPKDALMVGDTPADVLAGKAAGTKTCAVTYGYGRRDEMAKHQPDYWVDDLRELLS